MDVNHTAIGQCGTPLNVFLSKVAYTTTSVDDGNLINWPPCTEGSAVSPTSQTWTQTDTGAFECGVSCDNSGPSLAILYE